MILQWAKTNNYRALNRGQFIIYPNDVNVGDEIGNTALYYAAKHGNQKMCQHLLEKGAFVNTVCSLGDTAFHMGFKSGSIDTVELLYERGGDPNVHNKFG